MPKLGEHVDFITELLEQLLIYFWIENLFYGHFEPFVAAPMDSTKATHRYFLINLQILEVDFHDWVQVKTERVFAILFLPHT